MVGTSTPSGWRAGLPWAVAGAALGALITVVIMRTSAPAPGDATDAITQSGRAPDISQMTPADRANRLFNRVMIAAEAGNMDSVRFFMPMALGAYQQLPTRDADAHYHIGLLQLAGGSVPDALAEADSIQRAVPTHLFIYVLRAHAYQQQGNAQQERRAYADFLRHEAAELAKNRPEYADHREALNSFHAEAARQ